MKKNIIANFVGRFWSIMSNFLFIPLYIRYLGFESYSIISFTLVIAGLMAILDAGLTATLSREFARTDNETKEKIKIFKTLELTYLIVIGVCILAVFSLSTLIANHWLNLKSFSPLKVSYFLKIISFDIGFQLLLRFYMGGLLGLERQIEANLYQVGWGVLRNGAVVVALLYFPNLEFFFYWQTVSTIIFVIVMKMVLEKNLSGQYSLSISTRIEKKVFQNIWKFAGGMLLIALVAALNTQMDKIAISKFLSLESLGYYTLAISVSQGIIVLVNPIGTALLPRFTAQYSANLTEEATALFNKANLYISILVFSVSANLMFFSEKLLWIWTGDLILAAKSAIFLPIVAFSMSMLALATLPSYIAIANGYTKLNNILGVVSLFLTIPGYWIVTKHYGAIGAACVFCFMQTVTTFIYLYFINKKFIKSKVGSIIYFRQIFFPMILTLGISFIFSLVLTFNGNNRILSLFWIGLSTILTLGLTGLILIDKKDIKKINIF